MTRIFFMYDNLIDSADLTESSQATGYPAENVQQMFRTKVWTTEGVVAGTANLVIDHGSAKDMNCIVLAGYDWASAPGTLDIEFNNADNWVAPAATESLTWSANPATDGNKAVIVEQFSTTYTYRYARLNVVYAPGDWSLGRIFLGEYFTPTFPFTIGIKSNIIDPSKTLTTIGGQDHTDELNMYRTFSWKMPVRSQAQWELFQTMINSVGVHQDFFIAFDYTNEPNEMTVYGRFTKLPRAPLITPNYWEISFDFKEAR